MPAKKPAEKKGRKPSVGFSKEERAAAQERVREMAGKGEGEGAVLEKIAKMKGTDRDLATRFHKIVKANAPGLSPKTWYGMPAYAKDDKVICFFQDAAKFKARYATVGFSDKANLDEGNIWPVVYALKELSPAEEAKIAALVKKATS